MRPTALGGLPAMAVAPTSGAPRCRATSGAARGPGTGCERPLRVTCSLPSPSRGPGPGVGAEPARLLGRVGPRGPGGRLAPAEETCGTPAALLALRVRPVLAPRRAQRPGPLEQRRSQKEGSSCRIKTSWLLFQILLEWLWMQSSHLASDCLGSSREVWASFFFVTCFL